MAVADDDRLRVDVLTGFLGSGKTSLIRRLLALGLLADTAILVNEFSDLPFDLGLIALSGGEAAMMGETCICCAVDGNLRDSLLGLLARRGAGEMAFSRVLIETSGIADPTPLIATLSADPTLRSRVRLGRVVTLVDLCHARVTMAEQEEALSQIVAADTILLTKSELAEVGAEAAARAALTALNPIADMHVADETIPKDPFRSPAGARHRGPGLAYSEPAPRHAEIGSTVLRWEGPLQWAPFAAWLSLLLHHHGPRILRLKGTMTLEGEMGHGPVVIQSVRHMVHLPEHTAGEGIGDGAEIVVITRGIDPMLVRRSFEAAMRHAEN